MKILITTPGGRVGSQVTRRLLDAGVRPVLLSRHPDKVAAFVERGAEVRAGSLLDEGFVVDAARDADTLFWVTPPDPAAADLRALQQRYGAIAAKAIAVNGIARVVNLSSLGAHLDHGVGPVNGLHDVEKAIDEVARNVTHLRPTAFMENTLFSLPALQRGDDLYLPVSGAVRMPYIATADIARVAADALTDTSWSRRRVLTLFGPGELSYDEMAAVISESVGRAVRHIKVPISAAIAAMTQMGLSESVATSYAELYAAFESGLIFTGVGREPDVRTQTSFREFARGVLAPLVGVGAGSDAAPGRVRGA